jgi:outer membrane receptor protein involved in Fe transport
MVILQRDAPLLLVVHTLHSPSRLARRLNRRKEKSEQNPDNRNHDQQLDQRETAIKRNAIHFLHFLHFLHFQNFARLETPSKKQINVNILYRPTLFLEAGAFLANALRLPAFPNFTISTFGIKKNGKIRR